MKAGETPGYPRVQGASRYHSCTSKQFGKGATLEKGFLVLSKIGRMALRWSRPLEGTPKTVTVSREADGYSVRFSCAEAPTQLLPTTGRETGINVGLNVFLVTAQGVAFENPRHFRKAERRLKTAQRRVSRRKRGSHRRRKAVTLLAKAHQDVQRQRHDFHHKTALALVAHNDTIYLEDLRVANLVRNHRLAKSISDASWAQFRAILAAQAAYAGRRVVAVPSCRLPTPARTVAAVGSMCRRAYPCAPTSAQTRTAGWCWTATRTRPGTERGPGRPFGEPWRRLRRRTEHLPASAGGVSISWHRHPLAISLALLGRRAWQRGLAALGVLLAMYALPEFVVVLATLMVALVAYEVLQVRQHKVAVPSLVTSYAPLALGLLLSAYLLLALPTGSDYRSSVAVPWSYNDFYNAEHHAEFHGADSYANPWVLFEKDFGLVQPRTVVNTIAALRHNPAKAREYLTFDAVRLWASFGTSGLYSLGWRSDEWELRLQVSITAQDTWQFGLGLALFFIAAGACRWWLARRGWLRLVRVTRHGPALLGIGSLASLLVPLVLINPHQRFFMLFPLALLIVGYSLLHIWAAATVLLAGAIPPAAQRLLLTPPAQAARVLALLLLVAVVLPQPYLATPVHPIARTLALLRSDVPSGSTIVGEPVMSYGYYLSADGLRLHTISPATTPGRGLVGAFEGDPSLRYALLTRIYPQSTYDQWFADWNAAFPQLPWALVAQECDPAVQLYALPPHGSGYGQISYALWLAQAQQLKLETTQMPGFDALDFDQTIAWRSDDPGHTVQPLVRSVGGVPASSFIMHPSYPGLSAYRDVSSAVEASLSPDLSGHTLVFFAALAPWAASQPEAKGVRVVVIASAIVSANVVAIANDSPPHWTPLIVHLPPYTGSLTLKITIQPRGPISIDTTLVSFIGATQGAT